MEHLGFYLLAATVVYCAAMVHMQREKLDFHRDEEIKRLKERLKMYESE